MRTGGYGSPVGFLVKKYTCPVIFLGCPGRPGLVFVGPCTNNTLLYKTSLYIINNAFVTLVYKLTPTHLHTHLQTELHSKLTPFYA